MMLSWPTFNTPVEFSENRVEVLIVENPPELRSILTSLQGQISGTPGDFVLSENFEPKDISKLMFLVTDPLNLEFDTKKTLGKLTQHAVAASAQLPEELQNAIMAVNRFAASLCNELDFDTCFTEVDSADDIVKLMCLRLDRSDLSFPEQLLELMRIQRDFFGKQLFAFYNLKACLSTEELNALYKEALYNKLAILLIEDTQRSQEAAEHTMIIDKDLCII